MSFVNNIYKKLSYIDQNSVYTMTFVKKIPKNKSQNENTIPQIIQTRV